MKRLLVTGSSGLVGSAVVLHFSARGWRVVGVDNNMRRAFFGPEGDTRWNMRYLVETAKDFRHHDIDVRDREAILDLVATLQPDMIAHCAAQPSHDLAASRPFDDFDVNAVGTLNLLQAARVHTPDCVFVHMSTNKVYGDRPNGIKLTELETRWDYADPAYADGIDETMDIDQTTHSLFGASKAAADVLVQEYGRYFGMKTVCFRGGCLTGHRHSGVELHGFLNYLVKCNLEQREYTVFGYKGKQVRDNIHAHDVARCIEMFYDHPTSGEVFNLGGGRQNSISILEAFDKVSGMTGIPMQHTYSTQARAGDHICYISDLAKTRRSLKGWEITRSLDDIFEEIIAGWHDRQRSGP